MCDVSGLVGKPSRLLELLEERQVRQYIQNPRHCSNLLLARSINPTERNKHQMNVRIIVIVEESSVIECGCRLYR